MFERFEFTIKVWHILVFVLLSGYTWYVYHLSQSQFITGYKDVKHACLQVGQGVDVQEYKIFSSVPAQLRWVCEE